MTVNANTQKNKTSKTTHRYRVSVPDADSAVNDWFGLQDNPSVSVRLVIREYIERYGFDDPTCRPVDQQPRRGRPPGSSSANRDDDDHHDTHTSYESTSERSSSHPVTPVTQSDPDTAGNIQHDMESIFKR